MLFICHFKRSLSAIAFFFVKVVAYAAIIRLNDASDWQINARYVSLARYSWYCFNRFPATLMSRSFFSCSFWTIEILLSYSRIVMYLLKKIDTLFISFVFSLYRKIIFRYLMSLKSWLSRMRVLSVCILIISNGSLSEIRRHRSYINVIMSSLFLWY